MNYTLLIIDLQPEFRRSVNTKVISSCKEEITKAINSNEAIIFVEYADCGKTMKSLLKLTFGYNNKRVIQKDVDDGSFAILKAVKKYHFPKNHFRVCGVNTDACVEDTVLGLTRRFSITPKIEVVANGCFTSSGKTGHIEGLNIMKRNRNVRIV